MRIPAAARLPPKEGVALQARDGETVTAGSDCEVRGGVKQTRYQGGKKAACCEGGPGTETND